MRGVKKVLKHGGDGYRKIVARIERGKEWER